MILSLGLCELHRPSGNIKEQEKSLQANQIEFIRHMFFIERECIEFTTVSTSSNINLSVLGGVFSNVYIPPLGSVLLHYFL